MDYVTYQIELYHRWFLVCLILAVIFLMVTLFLFIKMDIKEVVGYLTGRQEKREIARLKQDEKTRVLTNRKHLSGILLWLVLFCGTWMNAEAVEDSTEELQRPVLQCFEITSGSDEEADALVEGVGNIYHTRNLEALDDLKIEIQIANVVSFEDADVKVEYLTDGTGEWKMIEPESFEVIEENLWKGIYLFDGSENEFHIYTFRVSYQDESGQEMTAAEDVSVMEIDGKYLLNYRVAIDKEAPMYTASYTLKDDTILDSAENGTMLEPYYCSKEAVNLEVIVNEATFDENASVVKVITKDANGEEMDTTESVSFSKTWEALSVDGYVTEGELMENESYQQKLNLEFTSEGHYKIEILLVDKSGNQVFHEKAFAMDKKSPEIVSWSIRGEEIQGGVSFGYFSKEETVVQIKLRDTVSGVKKICYTYEDLQEGTIKAGTLDAVPDEDDKTMVTCQVAIPYSFKGTIKAYGIDYQENVAEESEGIGVIAESEETHQEFSAASIRVLSKAPKAYGYYKEDVIVLFSAKDDYSGLNSTTYRAGLVLDETVNHFPTKETTLVTEAVKEYTLLASENNENNLLLELKAMDNAGYETTVVAPQPIHIDTTLPKITVEYDNHEVLHEKYYKKERIATVSVEERNFDPEDVHFELTGPDCEISSWTHMAGAGCTGGSDSIDTGHKDTCVWSTAVTFREDGAYSFGFHCTDLAGNQARYEQIDEFIIDTTVPVLKVEYDNHDVLNEFYYNAPRMATITIEEQNFDSEDVIIAMTVKDNGAEIALPTVSSWTGDGDLNQAIIRYDFDGEFTFDIEYMDLAGNEAADYEQDYFVMDFTEPEILITGIEPMSANADVVAPVITVTDTNFDNTGVEIILNGYQNGITEYSHALAKTANGEIIYIQDMKRVREKDDLYALTAMATDFAGNACEESIVFSVNRFGSVYTFDKETEKLAGDSGKYYTNHAQDLVVTETNVDTLEFKEITCNLNGKLRTLEEGKDFYIKENGTNDTWKHYTYQIVKDNFEEEGIYVVTIYSEDRAANLSDNHSKGKKIEFAVDKTSPSVLISGIEDNGQYRENSREVTIDVEDNIRLTEVKVAINEEETVYSAAQVQELDGKLTMKLGSANYWQEMSVQVFDAAGNEQETETIKFLITPNLFIQFFMNKPLFFGTVAVILGIAGTCWFIASKKKKNKNQI